MVRLDRRLDKQTAELRRDSKDWRIEICQDRAAYRTEIRQDRAAYRQEVADFRAEMRSNFKIMNERIDRLDRKMSGVSVQLTLGTSHFENAVSAFARGQVDRNP